MYVSNAITNMPKVRHKYNASYTLIASPSFRRMES